MNLAILTFQYVTDKPSGIPDAWPSMIVELGESTDLPGDNWVLMTAEDYATYLSSYQSSYDSWFTSHNASSVSSDYVQKKINQAIIFGGRLLIQFAAENVLLGITQSGKTAAVSDYLTKLQDYIATGSLYAARAEIIAKIADPDLETNYSPFLTVARLTSYKQMIETFLGI